MSSENNSLLIEGMVLAVVALASFFIALFSHHVFQGISHWGAFGVSVIVCLIASAYSVKAVFVSLLSDNVQDFDHSVLTGSQQ